MDPASSVVSLLVPLSERFMGEAGGVSLSLAVMGHCLPALSAKSCSGAVFAEDKPSRSRAATVDGKSVSDSVLATPVNKLLFT